MNNYRRNSKPHSRLLPYATIRAASEGDPDAVNAVLRHYEGYVWPCASSMTSMAIPISAWTRLCAVGWKSS